MTSDHAPDRWCRDIAAALRVDGAALTLYDGVDLTTPLGTSDAGAMTAEAVGFTAGEGPCVSAFECGRPVHADDIRDRASEAWERWPVFAAQLGRHTDYAGVFAYPVLLQDVTVGTLSLYRHAAGKLDRSDEAAVLAGRVGPHLLAGLLDGDTHEEDLGPDWLNGPAGLRRRQVWLAQGMISGAKATPAEALRFLRLHAGLSGRLVDDLADDVVTGRVPLSSLGHGGLTA